MMRILPALMLAALLAPSAASARPAAMAGMNMAPAKRGEGVGVVKAIDARAGTVTIQHGPIPAVGWPAMTMRFKANPPALLARAKLGQRVRFGVVTSAAGAEVTSLRP
jgi:Cu(I)/Ag(I) efflux system protein CusF